MQNQEKNRSDVASPNAGFTSGAPWIGLPARRAGVSAEAEEQDSISILSYYKRLIGLRKQEPLVSEGDIRFILPGEKGVIAYERALGRQTLTVYCNFTADPRALPSPAGAFVLGSYEAPPAAENSRVMLRPYEACVFKG